jgi:hypothetical protein
MLLIDVERTDPIAGCSPAAFLPSRSEWPAEIVYVVWGILLDVCRECRIFSGVEVNLRI